MRSAVRGSEQDARSTRRAAAGTATRFAAALRSPTECATGRSRAIRGAYV